MVMNKKEGSKMKGDSKTKIKQDGRRDVQKKNDSKSRTKTAGEDPKKSTKDTRRQASRSPSKVDNKDKAKPNIKKDESVKKLPTDTKKAKKTGSSERQRASINESKPSLKPKRTKDESSKPSKDSKGKSQKGDAGSVKKLPEKPKKSSKSEASPSKRSSKLDAPPKKAPPQRAKNENSVPKENDDHETNVNREPKSPKKIKTPTPEPPRKTPTPNYEDDFEEYGDDFEDDFEEDNDEDTSSSSSSSSSPSSSSSSSDDSGDESGGPGSPSQDPSDPQVLSPATNPDTHTKRLATAVPRKQYQPAVDTYAKHDWDPGELKKAIDSENKQAQIFDPVEFHKQKKARMPTSPPPTVEKRRPSVTVSFIAEEPPEPERERSDRPVAPQLSESSPSAVDFSQAKKEQRRRKSAQQRQGRGRALLSLIELFEQDFDLFEMEPASYDQIVANFGKSGLQQGTTQTNEDDLTEEIQTDEVRMRDKWTQQPIQFDVKVTVNNEGEVASGPTYYDYLGVGGDMDEQHQHTEERRHSSAIRLNKFLGAAGSCVLMLLEEEAAARTADTASSQSPAGLSFSSGATRLGGGVAELLAGRPADHVSFCDTDDRLLLTAHGFRPPAAPAPDKTEEVYRSTSENDAQQLSSLDHYGLVCVWSVNEPSQPQKVLLTAAQPVRCCFSSTKPRLAFAGSSDGSLDVWDLHESGSEQSGRRHTAAGAPLRSPTYSTAEIHRAEGHTDRLVALRPVPAGAADSADAAGAEPGSFQICSLDSAGRLVFWVAISSRHQANLEVLDGDLGLAPWGRVKLVKISHVCVDDFLDQSQQRTFTEAHDFRIDPTDPSHIYVSTDSGVIVHCTRQGGRPAPRLFRPEIEVSAPVGCLAFCPFEQPFLLAGGEDGSLRLHSTSGERPLITWNSAADGAAVRALCWSRHRPCVFFVLDSDSRINVWDLSAGDIFPAETDQVRSGQVTAMDLSYGDHNDKHVTHLAVSTTEGTVEVHKIADAYTGNTAEEAAAELEQFLHYVRII